MNVAREWVLNNKIRQFGLGGSRGSLIGLSDPSNFPCRRRSVRVGYQNDRTKEKDHSRCKEYDCFHVLLYAPFKGCIFLPLRLLTFFPDRWYDREKTCDILSRLTC